MSWFYLDEITGQWPPAGRGSSWFYMSPRCYDNRLGRVGGSVVLPQPPTVARWHRLDDDRGTWYYLDPATMVPIVAGWLAALLVPAAFGRDGYRLGLVG